MFDFNLFHWILAMFGRYQNHPMHNMLRRLFSLTYTFSIVILNMLQNLLLRLISAWVKYLFTKECGARSVVSSMLFL